MISKVKEIENEVEVQKYIGEFIDQIYDEYREKEDSFKDNTLANRR